MKIFKTELYKLITGRIFLLIVAVAVTLNAYLMFRTASSSESTPEEYKAIYSELRQGSTNFQASITTTGVCCMS